MPRIETDNRYTPSQNERDGAKDLICDIISLCEGGEIKGQSRLYKAFYHAHLVYYDRFPGILSTYPIVHMTHGPGIEDGETLLKELQDEGRIEIGKAPIGKYSETVIKVTNPCKPPESNRRTAIEAGLDKIKNKTATQLREETHGAVSWNKVVDGQEQPIYLDLLSTDQLAQMKRELAQATEAAAQVFGNR